MFILNLYSFLNKPQAFSEQLVAHSKIPIQGEAEVAQFEHRLLHTEAIPKGWFFILQNLNSRLFKEGKEVELGLDNLHDNQ